MKKKFFLYLIIHLSLNYYKLNSQITTADGYIINNDLDTIYGKIEFLNSASSKRCNFIKQNSKRIEFLKPEEINQYCIFPDIFYHSLKYEDDIKYFKVLEQGRLILYSNKNQLFVSKEKNQLVRLLGGEKLIENKGKTYLKNVLIYKEQLKQLVSDSNYFKKIECLKFTDENIKKFINEYNCNNPQINEKKKYNLYHQNIFGLMIGYSFTGYTVNRLFERDLIPFRYTPFSDIYKRRETPIVQSTLFGFSYKRKLNIDNLYFNANLIFEKAQNESIYYSYNIADTLIENAIELNFSSINIPISYIINIAYGKFRPFIDIGFNGKFILNEGISPIQRTFIEGLLIKSESFKLPFHKFIYGLKFGLGTNCLLNIRNTISYGVNFEFYPLLSDKDFLNKIYSINFHLLYCL